MEKLQSPSPSQASDEAKKRMQAAITGYAKSMPTSNFDRAHAEAVTVQTAVVDLEPNSIAKATFAFTIPAGYANNPVGGGETHGGAVTTFLDNLTSITLLASKRYWGQGMSRTMNVTFLRTPKQGDRCVIEAEVLHIGRQVATIHARMRREVDGVLLACCTHEKIRVDEHGKGYEEYYAKLS